MKTAEEAFIEIQEMDPAERFKLVRNVLDFNRKLDDNHSEFLIELIEEFAKVKQDIEFISGKLGVHDTYINRLLKQVEKEYFVKNNKY